jgi:hypothetical protein
VTTVSTRVFARDGFGRFLAKMEDAARDTVNETLQVGVNVSRAAAPIKTGRLRGSFYKVNNGHSGYYGNRAPYAKFQDEGVAPNPKPGNVTFFWDNAGYQWKPGHNTINHPGNPATHFMLAGYEAMRAAAPGIMQKHYL